MSSPWSKEFAKAVHKFILALNNNNINEATTAKEKLKEFPEWELYQSNPKLLGQEIKMRLGI